MRRFSLLAALLLPLLVPGTAQAGGCPAGVAAGVVDKDTYRLGEVIDFFDSYHDFADPGTVTITFERTTDGATREFTANNGPDGTWYLMLTVDSAEDIGTWDVTVVVDQTDALDTCTDRVIITGRTTLPPTDTVSEAPADGDEADRLVVLGLLLATSWAVLRGRVRGSVIGSTRHP
jgi:hypothetical protein